MTTLQGRYEIIETLGSGATSRVDKARDMLIGRTVALKTFLHGFGSGDIQKQFLREAQIIGQLSHPFIVGLYDVGTDSNSVPYFVMEYVEGKTLESTLEDGPLPLEKAAIWAGDLSAALSRAHRAKIIHGDIKPANIMITREGQIKLGDFGIARFSTQMSASGSLMGTPAYLSPEQILGHTQDTRSDLFSLGIILYQMATGVRPFTGTSVSAVCAQIVAITPPPPSHYNPNLPPAFDHIVMRCLAKDPAQRYATAEALGASLYPFARGQEPTPAPTPAPAATRSGQAVQRAQQWAADANDAAKCFFDDFSNRLPEVVRVASQWWNRPWQKGDMWATGIAALVVLSLVPVALRSHAQGQPVSASTTAYATATTSNDMTPASATRPAGHDPISSNASVINISSNGSAMEQDSSDSSTLVAEESKPVATHTMQQRHATTDKSPDKPKAVHPSQVKFTAALPLGEFPNMTLSEAALSKPSAPVSQKTTLHVDVVSAVTDQTLAVFSGDELLLSTPLQSAHRGDTLRFNCPITAGEHALRVVLYRDDKTISVHKENTSQLHADGANSMEVRINRRSKMLVKHETALEVVWPRSTAISVKSSTPVSAPAGTMAMR
jgi:serine/threonine protein kinase